MQMDLSEQHIKLSSASALNLDKPKVFSFDKGNYKRLFVDWRLNNMHDNTLLLILQFAKWSPRMTNSSWANELFIRSHNLWLVKIESFCRRQIKCDATDWVLIRKCKKLFFFHFPQSFIKAAFLENCQNTRFFDDTRKQAVFVKH